MKLPEVPALGWKCLPSAASVASWFENIPDLDPDWAERNPDKAMAWFFVTPRPCEALDRLLTI